MRSDPPRKFLVPESIQTSAMDCGPASLKAVLEGFGISASYGRLREACQTDVEVSPQRPGNLLGKETAESATGDAPHQLADHETDGQ